MSIFRRTIRTALHYTLQTKHTHTHTGKYLVHEIRCWWLEDRKACQHVCFLVFITHCLLTPDSCLPFTPPAAVPVVCDLSFIASQIQVHLITERYFLFPLWAASLSVAMVVFGGLCVSFGRLHSWWERKQWEKKTWKNLVTYWR